MKVSTIKCPQLNCGYEWLPRLDYPKQCPLCKKYLDTFNKNNSITKKSNILGIG